MMGRGRALAFLIIVLGCSALAWVYALRAARSGTDAALGVSSDQQALRDVLREPHVLFRSTKLGAGYGRLVAVSQREPSGLRYETPLSCDRVDFAGGMGVCLTANRGIRTTYSAVVFDDAFRTVHTMPLSGIPSRVRLSPDGGLAGVTTFVSGHSYADRSFSTQTLLIDTQTGVALTDLESFHVTRDGQPFKQLDFNFWGVTFARDSNTFYATLSSGGVVYLVQGDASAREARVIGNGVECPSLSPDNQRLGFKKRHVSGGRMLWRLAVLELATGTEQLLETVTDSVDDQVAWLDDRRILYSTPNPLQPGSMIVSAVSLDGGPPVEFVRDAYSPSVGGGSVRN